MLLSERARKPLPSLPVGSSPASTLWSPVSCPRHGGVLLLQLSCLFVPGHLNIAMVPFRKESSAQDCRVTAQETNAQASSQAAVSRDSSGKWSPRGAGMCLTPRGAGKGTWGHGRWESSLLNSQEHSINLQGNFSDPHQGSSSQNGKVSAA